MASSFRLRTDPPRTRALFRAKHQQTTRRKHPRVVRSVALRVAVPAGSVHTGVAGVPRLRLFEQIVEQIQSSISKRHLTPGDQLPPERQLARRFGVSRTAVREAMKVLGQQGLVESRQGRGTFISSAVSGGAPRSSEAINRITTPAATPPDTAAHLAEVRGILEPEVAALAAASADAAGLARLRDACDEIERSRDPEAIIEADLDFRVALAEATGNQLILALVGQIIAPLREQRLGTFRRPGGHRRVLDAIERRDPEAARRAARNSHL